MIRHGEAPQKIEVHFVENDIDSTGLGGSPFPPVFEAVANALFKKLQAKDIIISRSKLSWKGRYSFEITIFHKKTQNYLF